MIRLFDTKGSSDISPRRYAAYVFIICASIVLIYLFAGRGMRFFLVPSSSMEPTLLRQDYLVTLKEKDYRRGDIVVMKDPEVEKGYLVKRIVAVANDTVAIEGGALSLNGAYASEPYLPEPMAVDLDPVEIPEGHVFVLGDNRNHSDDSSVWEREENGRKVRGLPLPAKTIIGKVRYIYNPISRMGPVSGFPLVNSQGN
jgi:signal peptidase I